MERINLSMEKRSRERLSTLPPDVRVTRMQALLRGIVRSNYSSTHNMIRFMNLFDVHAPTVTEDSYDGFLGQLDQPGLIFSESSFDYIVARYDDLTSSSTS
jgi:hypothetical protein